MEAAWEKVQGRNFALSSRTYQLPSTQLPFLCTWSQRGWKYVNRIFDWHPSLRSFGYFGHLSKSKSDCQTLQNGSGNRPPDLSNAKHSFLLSFSTKISKTVKNNHPRRRFIKLCRRFINLWRGFNNHRRRFNFCLRLSRLLHMVCERFTGTFRSFLR